MNETDKTAAVEAPVLDEPGGESGALADLMRAALLAVAVTASIAAAVLSWMAFKHASAAPFATVDIAAFVKEKEAQFTALLSKPSVSDADRQAAFIMVQKLGPEIERAVSRLQQECGCTILVKSAVVAGPSSDLTPRLRELLDMRGAMQ